MQTINGGSWSGIPSRPGNQRRSTRELIERYHARELAPQPAGMSAETYLRLTSSPTKHQALWGGYWLGVLHRAGS